MKDEGLKQVSEEVSGKMC